MANSKLIELNEKIADFVTGIYKNIETTVTESYKKIEDAFILRYLIRDGESLSEARERINATKKLSGKA